MDPVSLALGIAPLCVGALKGAKLAKSKIKLLKHHDAEVSRFRKKFRTQVSIFRDESQLLLHNAAVDPDLAAVMLDDYNHEHWASTDLDDQIRQFLGKKHSEVKQVAEQIRDQIAKFDQDLSKLEADSDEESGHGKLTIARHRAHRAIGVASKKSSLDEGIQSLKDSVFDFKRLRKSAKEFQKPAAYVKQRKALPRTYGTVARHSASFLETLTKTWSCLNSNGVHSTHTAKLFLDTDASDSSVNFRMILEYEAISGSLRQHSLLFLRIQSEELSWVDIGLPAPDAVAASSEVLEPPTKARRVRFADSPGQSLAGKIAECQNTKARLSRNLCQAKDVCQHVFDCGKEFHRSRQEGCVGYLRSTDNLTHQLLTAQDRESTAIQTRRRSPTTLASILHPSKKLSISVNEQLRLALRLARSMLQYHSTPWWRGNWTLSDISYFDVDAELSISLATLHIDAKLAPAGDRLDMSDAQTQLVQAASDDARTQMYFGIRNVTIYSLGAALLQIGRWEALDAGDVVVIREKAEAPSRLGPRYDDLTAKCLYCDFGLGGDLNKPQLQGAVYENVVAELEQMVALLEGRFRG